jgi:hypothetical protein
LFQEFVGGGSKGIEGSPADDKGENAFSSFTVSDVPLLPWRESKKSSDGRLFLGTTVFGVFNESL